MKRITVFLLSILCFTACDNEIEVGNIQTETPQLKLFIPDAADVKVYSAATVSECRIDTAWVVAFDPSTHNKKWAEMIVGSRIVNNGQASQLLPQLTNTPAIGDIIVCMANVDPKPDTTSVTYDNINDKFKLIYNNYYFGGEYLPMYGELIWSSNSGYTCTMTRAVAKLQVKMGTSVSDVTGNFTAENVVFVISAAGDGGYIKPNPGGPIGIPQTYPFLSSMDHKLVQNNNATENENHIYIHEYPSSNRTVLDINTPISDTDFNYERQHIILKKNNSPAPMTYYRLDFFDSKTGKFLDTKRNHHYIFTINKVRSEGYTSIDQAQRSPGSNLEYTVFINDDSKHITSNGQYAIVSSVDTAFIQTPGVNNIATIKYHLPDEMTSPYSNLVNSVTIQPGYTNFSIVSPSSLTGSYQNVIINVTGNNSNTEESAIIFRFGNILHKIVIVYKL